MELPFGGIVVNTRMTQRRLFSAVNSGVVVNCFTVSTYVVGLPALNTGGSFNHFHHWVLSTQACVWFRNGSTQRGRILGRGHNRERSDLGL